MKILETIKKQRADEQSTRIKQLDKVRKDLASNKESSSVILEHYRQFADPVAALERDQAEAMKARRHYEILQQIAELDDRRQTLMSEYKTLQAGLSDRRFGSTDEYHRAEMAILVKSESWEDYLEHLQEVFHDRTSRDRMTWIQRKELDPINSQITDLEKELAQLGFIPDEETELAAPLNFRLSTP